ncbi:2-hydroxyacid dehydrogenase [Lichenicola sp.]|uniref:2-hydroxyacid dehydrogenase n=1 Tax=Lichenicola sp. TaxID=2804529 RepID=UPI003B00FF26
MSHFSAPHPASATHPDQAAPRVVVNQEMPPLVEARLQAEFQAPPRPAITMTPDDLLAATQAFRPDALMITVGMKLAADLVQALPDSVRMIANVGVGYDHIDRQALARRGILLTNTPDVLTECNADLTFMLILGACRRASEYGAVIRAGWGRPLGMTELLGIRVAGKTLGIVGMGRIGRAVAQRARGFGMQVLYCNRTRLAPELEQGARYVADLAEMLPLTQVLSLHAPGGAETENLIGARELALLPDQAVLVNAARGGLLDEEALFAALDTGRLSAAGLDVFRNEPDIDPRFLEHPRLFMTPHVGSATIETRTAMGMRALDNIASVCAGGPALDAVTR